jgi:hypothetical protein
MAKQCYWRKAPATSREHVPPKCIFPEETDTENGENYRIDLITVPSCDAHNGAKSEDDVYFLSVLAICILNNAVGTQQAKTKVMRALEKNPKLAESIINDFQNVVAEDIESGGKVNTVAFRLDNDRLVSAFEHIARALYYHHYGDSWEGSVTSFAEFQMALDGNAIEKNESYEEIRVTADAMLENSEQYGSNPMK